MILLLSAAQPAPDGGSHTTRNVLSSSLKTLSTLSTNITFGAMLSSALDPLRQIVDDIEQTSANKEGLARLAARIELLTQTVSNIANNDAGEGTEFAKDLEREFEAITKDLRAAADEQGHFDKFFGNTDAASSLAKHNSVLDEFIAEFRGVDMHEVLGAVEEEFATLLQFIPSGSVDDGPISPVASESSSYTAVLEDITGEPHPGLCESVTFGPHGEGYPMCGPN
ncbi:hypothetical protein C8R43DRAFT_113586 [Mycena crocata]|nr:hypothetical protein C8R43DRAFT_113586 [Mycena crocata]